METWVDEGGLQIQIDETKIRFCGDCCETLTDDEIQALLRELAAELYPVLQAEIKNQRQK